ncbi:MAG: glycosyltransferase, partial [Bacteroidota bacterium]
MVMYFFTGWLCLKKHDAGEIKDGRVIPFVSIIVPVRNESENIRECLESIFKQNYPKNLFEVILIDDYSTDSTLQMVQEF